MASKKSSKTESPVIDPVSNTSATPDGAVPSPKITLGDIFSRITDAYGASASDANEKSFFEAFKTYFLEMWLKYPTLAKYNLLVLFDDSTMVKQDADSIYSAISKFSESKPLLLVLYSRGGDAGSAYLIGKLCRENSADNFVITVPRHAKSAATLLCCAADEIHMGSLSELGPIDPQISGMPALGLKHSIANIAQLIKENPESAEMFAKYLKLTVQPIDIGYYERVAESAIQYAERLLATHKAKLPNNGNGISFNLVYNYKDHGFVIDKSEAELIFGKEVLKINTDEYRFGNEVYKSLSIIKEYFEYLGYSFYFIGCLDSKPRIVKRK